MNVTNVKGLGNVCSVSLAPFQQNFKGAFNQFGSGLILKCKDLLSILGNGHGSSMSVFSCIIFQK